MKARDALHIVQATQYLDGWVLARHLGAEGRPWLVDFDTHDTRWSWRKDEYTPRELAELWKRQMAAGAASRDYPVGLYVHVPFCSHTCSFCRCFRMELTTGRSLIDRYVDFVCDQIDFFAPTFEGVPFRYFSVGGGTPSILPPSHLRRLFSHLASKFDVRLGEHPLSTFEMTVPTMHDATLEVLREVGVPRISVGVQTLGPDIRRANRMFEIDPDRLSDRVAFAKRIGLAVNLDLVLGLPDEPAATFLETFERLIAMAPSSVIVNVLNSNYFERVPVASPGRGQDAAEYLRQTGEGMARIAARAGYRVYPHGSSMEAIAFLSPEFERLALPHWEVFKRLASGVNSVKVGTPVFALGTMCHLALLPDLLIACHDQSYELSPDKKMYRACRKEVFSVLYPKDEDAGPPFSQEQRAIVDRAMTALASAMPEATIMPSSQDVLVEVPDPPQEDGVARVFLRPEAPGSKRYRKVGSLDVGFNGELTAVTDRVVAAITASVARAAHDLGAAPAGASFDDADRELLSRAIAGLVRELPSARTADLGDRVVIEFRDDARKDLVGKVFVAPAGDSAPRYREVGPFALSFGGLRSRATERAVAAVERRLAKALAERAEAGR